MTRGEADALVARVRDQYATARRKSTATTALSWLTDPFNLFEADDSTAAAAGAGIESLGEAIDRWATVLRKAAEAGRGTDGRPYTWSRWQEYGNELGETGATYAGARWEASLAGTTAATAAATGRTLAAPAVAVAGALQAVERNARGARRWLLAGGGAAVLLVAGAAAALAHKVAG